MNDEERDVIIRRILVALDASPHSQAALEAAASLAARFAAELSGLFVEDINLLRLAELPFAHEVGMLSPTRRRLHAQEVERQLRAQAARARRNLEATAERSRVRWSFRVARGVIASEVATAAAEVDVLILGKAAWSLTGPRRLGSTVRMVLSQVTGPALILQHGTCLGQPVLVIYDGSPLARKALSAAAALANEDGGSLEVLILADAARQIPRLRMQADGWLRDRGLEVHYQSLTKVTAQELARAVHVSGCSTLVLPAESPLLENEALLALLDEIGMPVLWVR